MRRETSKDISGSGGRLVLRPASRPAIENKEFVRQLNR
jgi:hypothetical protein